MVRKRGRPKKEAIHDELKEKERQAKEEARKAKLNLPDGASKYVSRWGPQQGEHYHPFFRELFECTDESLGNIAKDCGWSYRKLHRQAAKPLAHVKVVDIIRIGRTLDIDPDVFWALVRRYYAKLPEATPHRGYDW